MPRDPPVTRARFPSIFFICSASPYLCIDRCINHRSLRGAVKAFMYRSMRKKDPSGPVERASRGRGRPREFDREAALTKAMKLFWTKGYEATSIADLTEA